LTEPLVIRGGTVFTPDGPQDLDVHVADGVITSLEPTRRAPSATKIVDAHGLYVLPGAIDAHVHSRDPGFPEKEDFSSLTAAAAVGGVTTVMDMPNTVPAVDGPGVLEAKAASALGRARVDFGLWGLVRSSSTPEQFEGLAAAGVVGFKAYLGYAFSRSRRQVMYVADLDDPDLEPPPDYGTLTRLAPIIAKLGLPIAIHAEDPGMLASFRRPLVRYSDVLASRPPEAEAIAIEVASAVMQQARARLHIVHLSSALGLNAAERAISSGSRLTLETCPQYLWLTDQDFGRLGTTMKMYPPIRTDADRTALVDGLATGTISMVGTDHAPHTDDEKARSLEDAPAGSPGLQTLYVSCLELAKRLGNVWMAPRWVCEGPARLTGLDRRKGAITRGFDADLVLVDPLGRTMVRAEGMHSRQRHSAMEGFESGFEVKEVYLRGNLVAARGKPQGPAGGRWMRPDSD
jgi:allantoinase